MRWTLSGGVTCLVWLAACGGSSPAADGGTDAGRASDAGGLDGGGIDGGGPDGGAVDAGAADAGGAQDAGDTDAGPYDGGPPFDAGPQFICPTADAGTSLTFQYGTPTNRSFLIVADDGRVTHRECCPPRFADAGSLDVTTLARVSSDIDAVSVAGVSRDAGAGSATGALCAYRDGGSWVVKAIVSTGFNRPLRIETSDAPEAQDLRGLVNSYVSNPMP